MCDIIVQPEPLDTQGSAAGVGAGVDLKHTGWMKCEYYVRHNCATRISGHTGSAAGVGAGVDIRFDYWQVRPHDA